MKKKFLSLLALISLFGSAHAKIYKWVDDTGATHYSSSAPSGTKAERFDVESPKIPSNNGSYYINHKKMLDSMSFSQKSHAFKKMLSKEDKNCKPFKIFFQGYDKDKSQYWNVACDRGKSYIVSIKNNKSGSTRVMNCEIARAMGSKCFTKF